MAKASEWCDGAECYTMKAVLTVQAVADVAALLVGIIVDGGPAGIQRVRVFNQRQAPIDLAELKATGKSAADGYNGFVNFPIKCPNGIIADRDQIDGNAFVYWIPMPES